MSIVEVKVPQLSESVAEATMLQWKKKAGDTVAADEILIEIDESMKNISCTYYLQVETYGRKEFAKETLKDVMDDGEASIDEVNSVARPGKIFYRVLMGPYENRSAVNNSRERIAKKGYSPLVRQSCITK